MSIKIVLFIFCISICSSLESEIAQIPYSKYDKEISNYCYPNLACLEIGILDARVPDPEDCHKFYICLDEGNGLQASDASLSCSNGTYFNSDSLQCENETTSCSNLQCGGYCSLACRSDLDLVGYPGNCSLYYLCSLGGDEILTECPVETPYFNGYNCTASGSTCCDFCIVNCEAAGIEIPDPYNCRNFYLCTSVGTPTEDSHFECAAGEIFNPTLGSCEGGTSCEPLCESRTTIRNINTSPASTIF